MTSTTLQKAQERYYDALARWNNAQSDRAAGQISWEYYQTAHSLYLEARGEYVLFSVCVLGTEPDDL
jgi:hypothetical protein